MDCKLLMKCIAAGTILLICSTAFCKVGTMNGSTLLIPMAAHAPDIDGEMDDMWYNVTKSVIHTYVDGFAVPDNWLDLFGTFRILWNDDYIFIYAEIKDDVVETPSPNVWENDGLEFYFDGDNSKNSMSEGYDSNDKHFTFVYGRSDETYATYAWKKTDYGYNAEFSIPVSALNFNLSADQQIGLEVQINDNDYGSRQHIDKWWNSSNDSWLEPALFGTAKLYNRAVSEILDIKHTSVTPVIDGHTDVCWTLVPEFSFNVYPWDNNDNLPKMTDWNDCYMSFRTIWDENRLYLMVHLLDDEINTSSSADFENDSIELFFDGGNEKGQNYDINDSLHRWVYNDMSNTGTGEGEYAWLQTDDGYQLEISLPENILNFALEPEHVFGFEIQFNDNDGGYRNQMAKWWSPSNDSWLNPGLFGTAQLINVTVSIPPEVDVTSPEDGTVFFEGESFAVTAEATDPDGQVVLVEFYNHGNKIGEDADYPYSMNMDDVKLGQYVFSAVATDNTGDQTVSSDVKVLVTVDTTLEQVKDVLFSVERGFYEQPFDLSISTETDGAVIYYTVDGSTPPFSSTVQSGASPLIIHIDPSDTAIRGTMPGYIVRACASKTGMRYSKVQTHTYLFVNQIVELSPDGEKPGDAWPEPNPWVSDYVFEQIIDYGLDRGITEDSRYKNKIVNAMLDIPTISMVTDLGSLFDPDSGIYFHAPEKGPEWERKMSIELLNPDGSEGFQIDAGVRIRGGWSRHGDNPKHAFRLFFRGRYGAEKLEYPLFGDEGTDRFDKIDLRTSQNYSWSYYGDRLNTMNRDVFSRDLQREMGRPYTRSRYYHLYINGVYWGLFQSQERAEARYAASYFGGRDEDYDAIKENWPEYWGGITIKATDGNLDAWEDVWEYCQQGFRSNDAYFELQGRNGDGTLNTSYRNLVDIDNLIDYMLVIFYCGNFDSPVSKFMSNDTPHNFYCIYNRNDNEGFKFFAHDAEHSLLVDEVSPGVGIDENRVNIGHITGPYRMTAYGFDVFQPQWLHHKLTSNEEYRIRFADHIYRHFYNGGVFTPDSLEALFLSRAEEIDQAIIAESARWGDVKTHPPCNKHDDWEPAIDQIVYDYFPYRGDIVLAQLKDEDLYPDIEPPLFYLDDIEVTDAQVPLSAGSRIVLTNPNNRGAIYYTTNGSDPRAIGGSVTSSAQNGGNEVQLTIQSGTVVRTRILDGSTWSAIHELILSTPDDLQNLRVTELHYHPLDEGDINNTEFEFIELKNMGPGSINLSLAGFTDGVDYLFPSGTVLASGHFYVIASNSAQFKNRYGFFPNGVYTGQLDNGGETVTLSNAAGEPIISFTYDDKDPWPVEPDGEGYSLVCSVRQPDNNPRNLNYWSCSQNIHGSPGSVDGASPVVEFNTRPDRHALLQNYPNPFNASTTLSFAVAEPSHVILAIYDILGRCVEIPINRTMQPGWYDLFWEPGDYPGGIYICRLNIGSFTKRKKLVYLK